jgi:hypothetical protein
MYYSAWECTCMHTLRIKYSCTYIKDTYVLPPYAVQFCISLLKFQILIDVKVVTSGNVCIILEILSHKWNALGLD